MDEKFAAWAARWRVPLGFVLGVVFLVLCQPTMFLLLVGGGVALAGILMRAYAAGCLDKDQRLATAGPYHFTRNPLYLGSLLVGLGFALAGRLPILGVGFVGFFLLVYWPVMRREERHLRRQFGEAYERYAQDVPLFFPVFRNRRAGRVSGEKFRWQQYRRNHEYEAALGYAAAMAFLILKIRLR